MAAFEYRQGADQTQRAKGAKTQRGGNIFSLRSAPFALCVWPRRARGRLVIVVNIPTVLLAVLTQRH